MPRPRRRSFLSYGCGPPEIRKNCGRGHSGCIDSRNRAGTAGAWVRSPRLSQSQPSGPRRPTPTAATPTKATGRIGSITPSRPNSQSESNRTWPGWLTAPRARDAGVMRQRIATPQSLLRLDDGHFVRFDLDLLFAPFSTANGNDLDRVRTGV